MKKTFRLFWGILMLMLSAFLLSSCVQNDKVDENGVYERTNINIFKDTLAWELAKAVKDQDTSKIKEIAKESPTLLDYQEPNYGLTPLIWATGMTKYSSVKTLLECGANPNIVSKMYKTYGEETALSTAAQYPWTNVLGSKNPKYVKLLLEYGADPNWTYTGSEYGIVPGTSILMESIGYGFEKTKALVEGGADINYKTKFGRTAAIEALISGSGYSLSDVRYAHYLIFERKASITEPYYRDKSYQVGDSNLKFYPVGLLKRWVLKLGSKEHKMKMEIVSEFERQGVDYRNTEVDDSTLEQIKQTFPNSWEEYLKKY